MMFRLNTMILSKTHKSPSWMVMGGGLFVMSIYIWRLYIHLEVQSR